MATKIVTEQLGNGEWTRHEYDSNGNCVYYEESNGYWRKAEYDSDGNEIYFEDSTGDWFIAKNK